MILLDGAGGRLRIEYVKSRLRLRFRVGDTNRREPIELTLGDFCDRLGIDRHLLLGDRCFLLFSGPLDAPRGGHHGLVGVFQCESEAREAFMALRRTQSAAADWGELVAIDERWAVRMLAWFGAPPGPASTGSSGEPLSAKR